MVTQIRIGFFYCITTSKESKCALAVEETFDNIFRSTNFPSTRLGWWVPNGRGSNCSGKAMERSLFVKNNETAHKKPTHTS